ncbi:MAG: EAL domain-containing protein [Porticoccus sp.]
MDITKEGTTQFFSQVWFAALKSNFFLFTVVVVLLFWIIDPIIDFVIWQEGTLYQQFFQPKPHELFMRSYISVLGFFFGYLASTLLLRSKQSEAALYESEGKYRTLFEKSADAILIIEGNRFIDCNQATVQLTGYKRKNELLALHPSELSPSTQPDGRDSFEKANEMISIAHDQGSHRFEWDHKRKNGEVFPVEVLLTAIHYRERTLLHVVWRDTTERKQANELLRYQASHDSLTGLVNRREFERRVERLLSIVKQDKSEHVLCYIDMDRFNVVNDTCGHQAGDEMLCNIGARLIETLRHRDTLARLGGDEFGILLERCSLDNAKRAANKIYKSLQDYRFLWGEHSFTAGMSMGLVPVNQTTTDFNALLADADEACYIAKDNGRNRIHVYDPEDIEINQHHGEMQWVPRINQALENDQFCLYVQDIVSLDDSDGWHCELLIRMFDESGNMIQPSEFLPSAERYDLISKIDRWVIENAFRALASHPEFLHQINFCSINLSGQSITEDHILDFIISQLHDTGIEAEKICFEVTETAAISNLSVAINFISTLKDLGCRFALDDFGSGLSSFAYLKNLPVDYLKIDGLFVKDMTVDTISHAMVKSINDIGQVMGMQTIAEFVESDEIKGMLMDIGVNYAQGYGIGRPQPFDEVLSSFDVRETETNTIEPQQL